MSDESKREASGEEKVIFDVGGKMYTVSRSLIEEHSDTMLARIVSKTWQEDSDSVVFIDRDGDTFRFVLGKHVISRECKSHDIMSTNKCSYLSLPSFLDYLRYGSVDLPHNMPMANFMRDMDFYGIIAEDASVSQISPADELRRLKQTVAEGELKHDMFLIAIHANHSFVTGKGSLAIANGDKQSIGLKHSPSDYSNSTTKASELLSGYLKTYYGLKGYDITFSKTSGMSVKLSKPDWGDEGWGDIFHSKSTPNPFADVAIEVQLPHPPLSLSVHPHSRNFYFNKSWIEN